MKALLDIGEEAAKFTGQLEKALKVSEYGALLKLCPCIDQGCSFLFLFACPYHQITSLCIYRPNPHIEEKGGGLRGPGRVTRVTIEVILTTNSCLGQAFHIDCTDVILSLSLPHHHHQRATTTQILRWD